MSGLNHRQVAVDLMTSAALWSLNHRGASRFSVIVPSRCFYVSLSSGLYFGFRHVQTPGFGPRLRRFGVGANDKFELPPRAVLQGFLLLSHL